ncbi:hypothetical protein XM77_c10224 [Vibrio vulnificus]|nr:hypothetical protein XM77_c10224 [Vibrio vulnificus]
MNRATQSSTTSTHPARQQRILRLPEVKAKTGFGRSTIYALMANGEFPRSIRIGARAVGWLESDIDRWVETHRVGAAYGRRLPNPRWQPATAHSQPARQHLPRTYFEIERA